MEVVLVAAAHVAAVHMEAAVAVGSLAAVEVVRVNQAQAQVADGSAVQVRANQVQILARAAAGVVAQANQSLIPIRIRPVHLSVGSIHRHRQINTLRQTHTILAPLLVRHLTHIKQPTLAVATAI